MADYLYYIGIGSVNSNSLRKDDRPKIRKVKREASKEFLNIKELELEGPFYSIPDLKSNSKIYSSITNDKTKQSILKPENILEFEKLILFPFEHSYEPDFIKLFLHVWVGKINKNDVSGVHFYNSDRIQIEEVIEFNHETEVYSAMIKYFDIEKKEWINKSKPTNFFPDKWTLQKLFKELDVAYRNKVHFKSAIYYGYTTEKIKVKIIIKENKALTMFPLIE